MAKRLSDYERKRRTSRCGEPSAHSKRRRSAADGPVFVVQRHDATNLHFDFRGHLKVALHGKKLTGGFALTHTKMGGDEANWMLVKVDDEGADRRRRPTSTQDESVLSGKTNEDF